MLFKTGGADISALAARHKVMGGGALRIQERFCGLFQYAWQR